MLAVHGLTLFVSVSSDLMGFARKGRDPNAHAAITDSAKSVNGTRTNLPIRYLLALSPNYAKNLFSAEQEGQRQVEQHRGDEADGRGAYARELSLAVLMANHSSPSSTGSAQDAARSGRPVGDRW